ncbi:SOS response-associated peptidase family protein [Klebsiella quasipneumoniae]|uniref:SOS response-associated peptidase family protein n=1 Tax=Klebsiella quasipneumoniae TaxID=1463165 RepID=UPI003CFF8EC0
MKFRCAPGWWGNPPLINARVETAATSRMFKPLWQHGRAICFADGWFEWKRQDVTGAQAVEIVGDGAVSADHFTWYSISRAVGNVKNQGPELIDAIERL